MKRISNLLIILLFLLCVTIDVSAYKVKYFRDYRVNLSGKLLWRYKLSNTDGMKYYWKVKRYTDDDEDVEELSDKWDFGQTSIDEKELVIGKKFDAYGKLIEEIFVVDDKLFAGIKYTTNGEIKSRFKAFSDKRLSPANTYKWEGPEDDLEREFEKELEDELRYDTNFRERMNEIDEDRTRTDFYTYFYFYKDEALKEDDTPVLQTETPYKYREITYNLNDKISSEAIFDGNYNITRYYLYRYSIKDNRVQRITVIPSDKTLVKVRQEFFNRPHGNIVDIREFIFDKKMNIKKEFFYTNRYQLVKKYIYTYDKRGNVIKQIIEDVDRHKTYKNLYRYDSANNVIEERFINNYDTVFKKNKYRYDSKANVVRKKEYEHDKLVDMYKYRFDDEGYQVYMAHYSDGGKLISYSKGEAFDDPIGKKVMEYLYGQNHKLRGYKQYKYDHRGNKIEVTHFSRNRKYVGLNKYYYDVDDRLKEKLLFNHTGYLSKVLRYYYDDHNRLFRRLEQSYHVPEGKLDVTRYFGIDEQGRNISYIYEDNFKKEVSYLNYNLGLDYVYYNDGSLDQVLVHNDRGLLVRIKKKTFDYSLD